jgi:hypothetical protein
METFCDLATNDKDNEIIINYDTWKSWNTLTPALSHQGRGSKKLRFVLLPPFSPLGRRGWGMRGLNEILKFLALVNL